MFEIFGLIPISAAAVAGFLFGALWYGVLGKAWMRAANLNEESVKPVASTMAIAFVCQIVMVLALAGVIWHMGVSSIRGGVISAILVWAGFVVTTLIVNHRFHGHKWALTLIDGGHWFGVLAVQGATLGALSD